MVDLKPGAKVKVKGIVEKVDPALKYAFTKIMFRHSKCGAEFVWPDSEKPVEMLAPQSPPICPICGESGGKFTIIPERSEGFPYVTFELMLVETVEAGALSELKRLLIIVPSNLRLPVAKEFVSVEGTIRWSRTLKRLYLIAEKIKAEEIELEFLEF